MHHHIATCDVTSAEFDRSIKRLLQNAPTGPKNYPALHRHVATCPFCCNVWRILAHSNEFDCGTATPGWSLVPSFIPPKQSSEHPIRCRVSGSWRWNTNEFSSLRYHRPRYHEDLVKMSQSHFCLLLTCSGLVYSVMTKVELLPDEKCCLSPWSMRSHIYSSLPFFFFFFFFFEEWVEKWISAQHFSSIKQSFACGKARRIIENVHLQCMDAKKRVLDKERAAIQIKKHFYFLIYIDWHCCSR